MNNKIRFDTKGIKYIQKERKMIQIDRNDCLYKVLTKLKADNIDDCYVKFANEGLSSVKDFNNYLQARLGLDYLGDMDESVFEEVLPYYRDLKKSRGSANGGLKLLKQYKQTLDKQTREQFVNGKLKDVLLIACAYKLRHKDINLSDLVQVCNIGLLNAIDKYEEQAKLNFDVYLHFWILNEIEKEFTIGG